MNNILDVGVVPMSSVQLAASLGVLSVCDASHTGIHYKIEACVCWKQFISVLFITCVKKMRLLVG